MLSVCSAVDVNSDSLACLASTLSTKLSLSPIFLLLTYLHHYIFTEFLTKAIFISPFLLVHLFVWYVECVVVCVVYVPVNVHVCIWVCMCV